MRVTGQKSTLSHLNIRESQRTNHRTKIMTSNIKKIRKRTERQENLYKHLFPNILNFFSTAVIVLK